MVSVGLTEFVDVISVYIGLCVFYGGCGVCGICVLCAVSSMCVWYVECVCVCVVYVGYMCVLWVCECVDGVCVCVYGVMATALGHLIREEGAESPWHSSEQPRTSWQGGGLPSPLNSDCSRKSL